MLAMQSYNPFCHRFCSTAMAAEGVAGIDGVLLMSVVEMGVLLPLF